MARRSFLRFCDLYKFQIFIHICKLTTFIFTCCFYILLQIAQSQGKITENMDNNSSINIIHFEWIIMDIQLNMEIGQPDLCMAMQNRRSLLFTRGSTFHMIPRPFFQGLNLGGQLDPKVPTVLPWNQTGTPDVSHWLRPQRIGYNCSNCSNCPLASK